MNTLDNIIKELGYNNSESLYYSGDINNKPRNLSIQTIRILEELNPYAYYCVDNQPLVLFFQSPDDPQHLKLLHKKIWNSQTAVSIFDCGSYIEIYNGFSLDLDTKKLPIVKRIEDEDIDYLSDFSYWNITDNNFWEKYKKDFKDQTIDTVLLDNIKYILDDFKTKSSEPFAVKLTLRLIFIRFLIDRGTDLDFNGFTNCPEESQQQLLTIIKSKEDLYKLFEHLKNKFNGNLFEFYQGSKSKEMELLDDDSLRILSDFLSGQQLASDQLSLFPFYDFNIIPVELISNIYERLLGERKQQEDKAFYTPPNLVDYILKQTVKPYLKQNKTCRVLDPACGSGIFLVETLRSLIENNLKGKSYYSDDKVLMSLLSDNIFGVDKNAESIDVAIFSLYLVLLEYKDPKCLKNFKLPNLKERNFIETDFFLDKKLMHLRKVKFDFIIGNPPWGQLNNSPHVQYCLNNNIPNQHNEISRSFIIRTKDFADKDTRCCLIVTSKLFYNSKEKAKVFREWLLTETTMERFIELAAVRDLIFKKAKGPAAVILYNFDNEQAKSNRINHFTLKPNRFFELFNIIMIESNDIKYIPQNLLLKDDWAWKTIVFGTTQDYYKINELQKKFKSMEEILDENGIVRGTGIQIKGEDQHKNSAKHLQGLKLINAKKGISAFNVDLDESTVFNEETIHRTRHEKDLFKPPFALIKKGLNTKNYRAKAAYSEDEMVYTDSIYGLVGNDNETHKELLLSLTGILNSSFYAYLNLMLGSSTGIEREQGFPTKILDYPALTDKTLALKVNKIQQVIQNQNKYVLSESNNIQDLINDLDQYVLSLFEMNNDDFLNYAINVQIPHLTGDKSVFKKVNNEYLLKYAQKFLSYWTELLNGKNLYVQIIIYPSIMNRFTAMEVLILDEEPDETMIIKSTENKNKNFELMSKFMLNKYNDLFYQIKDIVNFEEQSFSIIKTNEYKNWHPALSHLDLSRVINSILMEEEGNLE